MKIVCEDLAKKVKEVYPRTGISVHRSSQLLFKDFSLLEQIMPVNSRQGTYHQ